MAEMGRMRDVLVVWEVEEQMEAVMKVIASRGGCQSRGRRESRAGEDLGQLEARSQIELLP